MFDRPDTKQLISRLDERPAPASAAASIARDILVASKPNNALIRDAVEQYDSGFSDSALARRLQDEIGRARLASDGREQGAGLYHLAWGIFPNDGELDGYLAEFYIIWAKEIGVREDDILKIFSCHGL